MKVISSERIPIKMWLEDIEEGALQQAKNLANLPFAFSHIAIMPDSHFGFGMPIGGVLATEEVIVPNAVGVDIGCGVGSIKTSIEAKDATVDKLKQIIGASRRDIPMGFNKHKEKQDEDLMPAGYAINSGEYPIVEKHFQDARYQLGTLGGGNHFIEIQKGSDGFVYLMLHSGSRHLGLSVGEHYNKMAKAENKRWFSSVAEKNDLAFLPTDTQLAKDYIAEMKYCVDFAFASRKLMMDRLMTHLSEVFPNTEFTDFINIAHNYASLENHFGRNVWVHRKGATLATKETIGLIPGSQGTFSYVVRGKGNPESFNTCSHGAGRALGRNVAMKTLSLEAEQTKMALAGVVHNIRTQKDLDEAPGAYKDIKTVMENQKDLVEIVMELKPLGVMKGD